mmetsp:Transcript_1639/g.2709  ORF Transcript_1639/g.2709 Transcript_1639/m.2709 type:complete len:133 (+) Transcript_1639:1196-1594(+)
MAKKINRKITKILLLRTMTAKSTTILMKRPCPLFFLKYAALGGYPPIKEPIDMGKDLTISAPSDHLGSDFSFPKKGLCAIRMHKEIEGHGDINNPYVHWIMHCLVKESLKQHNSIMKVILRFFQNVFLKYQN